MTNGDATVSKQTCQVFSPISQWRKKAQKGLGLHKAAAGREDCLDSLQSQL